MRAWSTVCLASFLLSAGVARAASEASVDAASVVQEKVDREGRSPSVAESLRLVRASREADQKKAERIRDLPPERVQEWIDGKLSEADVERLTSEPQAQPEPEGVAAVISGSHSSRLLLAGLAVLVLAFFYARQRRRERMGSSE